MSHAANDDDEDLEAEFEAELAKLALDPDAGLEPNSGFPRDTFLTELGDGAPLSTDTDEESDDEESESFRLLRAALERRERALEEFGRDLEQVHQDIASANVGSSTGAPSAAGAAATSGPDADTAGGSAAPDVSIVVAALAAASHAERNGSTEAGGFSMEVAADAQTEPAADAGAADAAEAAAERRRLQEEWRAQEAARQEKRERQRQAAEAAAAAEAAEAEVRLRRQREELERQERKALAALEAERAAAAAEREAQLAAAEAERQRLAVEREATAVRLQAAAREAAAREAERRAAAEALERETLLLARRHLAARRIQRVWRRYAAGPARAARMQAVVRIQAAWRGLLDRRRAATRRQQRDVLRSLEEAAVKGRLEELHLAVERAKELGVGDAAQQRVAALESAAADAAAKLRAATGSGGVMAFRSALAAAQRYPHLAEVVAQSTAVFEGRQAAAASAVNAAVSDQPMSAFLQLLDAAGAVGVDPQQLNATLESVRRRDAQVAAQLAAAARGADFDPDAFAVLAQRGLRLGLQGDVAAARRAVERRARTVAAELRQAAAGASGREVAALAAEARRLGLAGEAAALEAQLAQRQRELQVVLEAAATRGSATRFAALMRQAEWLGLAAGMTQRAHDLLFERQARCGATLAAAASSGTLHSFLVVRGAAVRAGLGLTELLAADRAVAARRRQAAAALLASCAQLCGIGGGFCAYAAAGAGAGTADAASARALLVMLEAVSSALGLGNPQVILARAVGRLAQAPAAGVGTPPPAGAETGRQTSAAGSSSAQREQAPQPATANRSQPQEPRKQAAADGAPRPCRPPPHADALPSALLPHLLPVLESALQRGLLLPPALAEGGGPTGPGPGPDPAPAPPGGCSEGRGGRGPAELAKLAVALVWSNGVACLQLGLSDAACLALVALGLSCNVRMAEGSYVLRRTNVLRDYWGVPQLPPWQSGRDTAAADEAGADRALAMRLRGSGAQGGEAGSAGDSVAGDGLAAHVAERLRRNGLLAVRWFWPSWADLEMHRGVSVHQSQLNFWQAFLDWTRPPGPGRGAPRQSPIRDSAPSAPGTPATPDKHHPSAGPRPAAPAATPPPPSRRGPAAAPLTRAVILRNSVAATAAAAPPGTTSGGPPSRLDRLTRLDLGLEGLSSLAGLDAACPALRSLSADANQLTSLEGLARLSRLRALSLRHNQLTSLTAAPPPLGRGDGGGATGSEAAVGGLLPGGGFLRRLALDSNRLSGRLEGLEGCSGLRVLGLANNALTDVGSGLQPCAASLTALSLRGNCLTILSRAPSACTGLRSLDVSANRLTSLEGIQGLALLQSLDAHANAITSLPHPLSLPYLTSLDLSQNALTAFFGPAAVAGAGVGAGAQLPPVLLPSLQRLNLSENRISTIGPLGPMRHLTSLDLSFNVLPDLDSVRALAGLTFLLTLNLTDNPATAAAAAAAPAGAGGAALPGRATAPPPHRPVVLSLLPSLRELDHDGVSEAERAANAVRTVAACPVAAAALTAAVRMGTLAGGACLPMQRCGAAGQAFAAAGHSAAALSSAAPGGYGGGYHSSSSSSNRDRRGRGAVPHGGRRRGNACGVAPTPPLCRVVGLGVGSAGPADATALRSSLAAAVGPFPLVAGAAGSYGRVRYIHPCYGVSAEQPVGDRARQDGRSQSPSEAWLSHTERMWAAGAPYSVTEAHRRQLAVAQGLAPPPGPAAAILNVSAEPASPSSLSAATAVTGSAGGRAAGAAQTLLRSGEILDERSLRSFQPVARALCCRSDCSAAGGVAQPSLAEVVEARYDAAEAELQRSLAREVRSMAQPLQTAGGSGGGGGAATPPAATAVLPQPVVIARPSYYHRAVASARAAVAKAAKAIQAAWRGHMARRLAAELRSEAYQSRCAAAAKVIQAAWRGHRVRCGAELSQLRAAAAAEREARDREERRRRDAAATIIQAHVRGHLVRRRLRAALAASRLALDDDSGAEDDPELGGDEGDLLAFLAPLEKLFGEEVAPPPPPSSLSAPPAQPAASAFSLGLSAAAAAAVIAPAALPQRPAPAELPQAWAAPAPAPVPGLALERSPRPPVLPPVPAAGLAAAAPPATAAAAVALEHSPPSAHYAGFLPPLPHSPAAPQQQHPHAPLLPLGGPAARLVANGVDRGSASGSGGIAGGMAGSRPSPLLISESGSGEASELYGNCRVSDYGGSVGGRTPGEDAGVGRGGGAAASPNSRQARHLARLQALMAEWGFKDLATAEAYYRRTLRQKQGQTRKKLEDKYQDPAQRLRKLQQAVGASGGGNNGPMGRSPGGAPPPRAPPHGRPMPLAHGSLRGSPSRPSAPGDKGSPAAAAAAAGARPQRNLSSADDALAAGSGGGGRSVPVGGLPALLPRRASHGASSSAPLLSANSALLGGAAAGAVAGGGFGARLVRTGGSEDVDEDHLSVRSFASAGANGSSSGGGWEGRPMPLPLPPAGTAAAARLSQGMARAPAVPPQPQLGSHPRPNGRALLPALANNWVTSPSPTPPGHDGVGAAQLMLAPASVALPGNAIIHDGSAGSGGVWAQGRGLGAAGAGGARAGR